MFRVRAERRVSCHAAPRKWLSDVTYEDKEIHEMIRDKLREVDFPGVKSRIRFNQNQDPIITGFIERVQGE